MRHIIAGLILLALFVVLVGSRFQAADGDKLRAVSQLVVAKLQKSLPPTLNLRAPVAVICQELPQQPAEAVRARLASDQRFVGIVFAVTAEGSVVTLRGIVPDTATRHLAVSVAQNTIGVEHVIDELAVPAE
ncbi:MAG: BON domain-containing protein [Gemmataceae bacterium]|nr:BON domain-containing protein [Gemmata sp.]MDW8196265.1 BON domain-containing protein [Gemmataceae bacterium]